MLIGGRVRVEPYAVVQAGASLEPGTALGALRKAKSSIVRERKDPLAFMRAFGRGRAPSEDATAALKKCARAPPRRLSYCACVLVLRSSRRCFAGMQTTCHPIRSQAPNVFELHYGSPCWVAGQGGWRTR